MSINAVSWSFGVNAGDPMAKLVLLTLANYSSNEFGGTWISCRKIQEITGLSERTIRAKLHILEEKKLISRIVRTRKNGSHTSNFIHLACYKKVDIEKTAKMTEILAGFEEHQDSQESQNHWGCKSCTP